MTQIRKSKQRDAILTYLKGRIDHPSAELIYEAVKKDIPNISLGTVYRNLALLDELGEIRTLYVDGGADHFDADMTPHDHFICRKCKRIQDVPTDEALAEAPGRVPVKGIVEGMRTYYYGLCEDCM